MMKQNLIFSYTLDLNHRTLSKFVYYVELASPNIVQMRFSLQNWNLDFIFCTSPYSFLTKSSHNITSFVPMGMV